MWQRSTRTHRHRRSAGLTRSGRHDSNSAILRSLDWVCRYTCCRPYHRIRVFRSCRRSRRTRVWHHAKSVVLCYVCCAMPPMPKAPCGQTHMVFIRVSRSNMSEVRVRPDQRPKFKLRIYPLADHPGNRHFVIQTDPRPVLLGFGSAVCRACASVSAAGGSLLFTILVSAAPADPSLFGPFFRD